MTHNMKFTKTAIVLSSLVMILTACSFYVAVPTATPAPTSTVVPISTNIPEPTSIQSATPVPHYTVTARPSTIIDTQDGKLFISHEFGFSIILPSDSQSVVYNRADLSEILSFALPEIELDDGCVVVTGIHTKVENQTNSCHPALTDSGGNPIKMEKVTLGSNTFDKIYTPDLDKNELQSMEYMTYGANFCVHFFVSLTTYYFDRGDAQPSSTLSYRQDELDGIFSTFQWVRK